LGRRERSLQDPELGKDRYNQVMRGTQGCMRNTGNNIARDKADLGLGTEN
jgi:hypothetical protein